MRTITFAFLVACLITSVSAQKRSPKQTADSAQKPSATAGIQAGDTSKDKEEGDDKGPWKGLQYRLVGPFRGGRVVAVSGVVGQENIYYFGAVAGGVWKTTDGGLNWKPIFDKQKDASPAIGAIAVSESDRTSFMSEPEKHVFAATSWAVTVFTSRSMRVRPGNSLALPTRMPLDASL